MKKVICAKIISDAENSCSEWDLTVRRLIRIKRSTLSENALAAGLATQGEIRRSLREIPDENGVEVSNRFSQIQVGLLENRFCFLCKAKS